MRRILTALLLAGALFASTAGVASAQQTSLRDARHDMWRSTTVGQAHRASQSRVADLTRAVVAHEHTRIVITLSFVELRRSVAYANYTVQLQGPSRHTREVTLETSRRKPQGVVRVFGSSGRLIACTVGHRIDYRRDVVRLFVPRACLRRSSKIRANIRVHRSDAEGVFFADNPHNRLASSRAWTRWLRAARH